MKQKAKLQMIGDPIVSFDKAITNLAEMKQIIKKMGLQPSHLFPQAQFSDGKTITKTELKQLIQDEKIEPHTLFSTYELMHDPVFKDEVEKSVAYELKKKKTEEEQSADHIPGDAPTENGGGSDSSDGNADHIPD